MKNTQTKSTLQIVKDRQEEIRDLLAMQLQGAALKLLKSLFEEEVDRLCGKRFCHKSHKLSHRGGSEKGTVIIQGQRMAVTRPRLRKNNKEQSLESYGAVQSFDLLCEDVMKHMLSGVSTRNYESLQNKLTEGLGLKKSSVSKAFKRGCKRALEDINSRNLSKIHFVSLMIDGIEFSKKTLICVLGITKEGKKMILGLRESSTENSIVVTDLLQNLISRGLSPEEKRLFVVDGSKALRKAIKDVFGQDSLVQRCIHHKERNILSYLPKEKHVEFRRRWKMVHKMVDYELAKKECQSLIKWLSHINHSASESLEETCLETLTMIRLKTPSTLQKTLNSTNPIESAFSFVRQHTGRVKNWKKNPRQVSLWASASLLQIEKRFRLIRGYRYIPSLIEEINKINLEKQMEIA